MRERKITSLPGFVQETDVFDIISETVIFRGQAQQANLIPNIARTDNTIDTSAKEKKVIEQVRLLGASLLSDSASNSLELLVLAQHFGLRTRLLDWTSNPLAALWFACSGRQSGDGFVYALEADDLQAQDVYATDPFAYAQKTRVFQPRLNNPRIIAQHGWFTLHRYSRTAKRFVPLESNSDTKNKLTEIRIPASVRPDLLVSLDHHGISSRTLFPDLEGLCLHLNWRHKLG